jgi:multiple sugar transport system substrate-binding protein
MKRLMFSCLVLLLLGGFNMTVMARGRQDTVAKDLVFINDNPPFEQQNAAMGAWINNRIGIGFVPESYPDLTTYQTTLRQSLLSPNTAPDFFKWWSNFRLKPLVDEGLLEDVSDIWQEGFESGVWKEDAAAEVTFNGRQYALPYHYSHWGMIYNKKIFEELNLSIPKTWDEFIRLCRRIEQSGRTPISMTLEGRWQSTLLWSEVIMKTDADLYLGLVDGTVNFSDPAALKAMEKWIEVIQFFPRDLTLPWMETYPNVLAGEYAMIFLGDWLFTSLESIGADMDKDIGWFPIPSITPKGNGFVLEISPMAIPKNSPNKEQTKQLMREWMSLEGQKEWVRIFSESSPAGGGLIPDKAIFKSIVDAGLFTDSVRYMPRWYEAVPIPLCEYTMDKFAEVILDNSKLERVMREIDEYRARMR